MSNDSEDSDIHDCDVCYLPHDEEIHAATLRVRVWLNRELTRKLSTGCEAEPELIDPALVELQVA
jgi:hypothetical protein